MQKPKPAAKLNRDEMARRVFPHKVIREAKKITQDCGSHSQTMSSAKRPL